MTYSLVKEVLRNTNLALDPTIATTCKKMILKWLDFDIWFILKLSKAKPRSTTMLQFH